MKEKNNGIKVVVGVPATRPIFCADDLFSFGLQEEELRFKGCVHLMQTLHRSKDQSRLLLDQESMEISKISWKVFWVFLSMVVGGCEKCLGLSEQFEKGSKCNRSCKSS